MTDIGSLVGDEWAEWYAMTPAERLEESSKLWQTYLELGGSLEPEPDPQSPFYSTCIRLDVLAKIRGLPDFDTLWSRRTTLETAGETIDVFSLPDLVIAKKTQQDKDWPMITRLRD